MIATTAQGIPKLGLGTFGRTGEDGVSALLNALEIGYRHIDTAQSYDTESSVGEAVRRSGLARSEVFITTKVADTNLAKPDFLPSVEKSLETLGVDGVDLLLIHWPSDKDAVPFEDYMLALAHTQEKGWAKRIGVSNFPIALLEKAETLLGAGALSTNQVELHPFLQAPKLTAYAKEKALPLTAYMPLAKGKVSKDAVLGGIGEKHGVSAAAISLAFLMAEGHIVIPASSSSERLAQNMAAAGVTLDADDIGAIRKLDRGDRMIDPDKAPAWDD
ncbi:aldo/keto reductase [Pelagibacterium flavum]|uniref:Aldo/keto reductase n=1 Tax=Pelagibacterium flavum TaxID=2984530 RepID=A0ABY6IP89_9HYPH|nr:aldo/keto reductase [Pelagibacterium sp. YIM 151497]UYQ71277.1 aldo/keto reductase [Pelagibacterium sp. YIM 151497]|tara:strand:- start:69 stop:890 length:822 start_codon:yes stop_codon:yes gene_type:complete